MPDVFNKIGFHMAEGGNAQGIGEYMRQLDEANIPFFMKGADSMAGLFEAQQFIRARRDKGLPDLHTAVFRLSGQGAGNSYDIPNYDISPEKAAEDHWALHKAKFPSDLDPSITWVEHINEVRKEVEWGDWLGKFSVHSAQLAMADGFRYAAFAFSSGTPEPRSWETDGMLAYLELCARHPDQLAVALHEYSYRKHEIWYQKGYLIGGFQWLFRACDNNQIPRPKVMITEWGWEHDDVPGPELALKDIEAVGMLYARYPEIVGAAIWYLGGGYHGIANRAQALIEPVTTFSLRHRFTVPDEPALVKVPTDPPEFAGTSPVTVLQEPPDTPIEVMTHRNRFAGETIPDGTKLVVGHPFKKVWRLQNTGNAPWTDAFHIVFAGGASMTEQLSHPVPATAPGDVAEITVPLTAPSRSGAYRGDWQNA